ncbi:MAG TPA: hypothetical protein PLS16_08240 [Chitinophagales bacterium]|nr:hypothetical protein [Chitinophagales bacterium]
MELFTAVWVAYGYKFPIVGNVFPHDCVTPFEFGPLNLLAIVPALEGLG